jgi:hypothetical protein
MRITSEEDRALIRRGIAVFLKTARRSGKKKAVPAKPVSWESQRDGLKLAIKVFVEAWKAKRLRLLFNLIITGMEMELSWDEQIGRITGEYYAEQIKVAVEEYKTENPQNFTAKINVPGYAKWLESQKGGEE